MSQLVSVDTFHTYNLDTKKLTKLLITCFTVIYSKTELGKAVYKDKDVDCNPQIG
jgi:hypothetical protein